MGGGNDRLFFGELRMVDCEELRAALSSHFEWLAVRENGRTYQLRADEIEINGSNGRTRIGIIGDNGYRSNTVRAFTKEGDRIFIEIMAEFGGRGERIEFVARESAAALSADIELARLQKANEIAKAITEGMSGLRLTRVSLNADNGRLAQIILTGRETSLAVLADVTASQTHETLLTTALKWREKLRGRQKNAIKSVWIAGEKRQARAARKLCSLLNLPARENLGILELLGDGKPARQLRIPAMAELWREKSSRQSFPTELEPSDLARRIIALSPDNIDIVYSAHGETLRFHGLPFARVRRAMGREAAWFGVGPKRRQLDPENPAPLEQLIVELQEYRRAETPAPRHEYYRMAPEAWLESILRRNINLLDANLILSPIYNQFRSSRDKIDLLALRKDGRLVIIELKTSPDREMIFQAADYWRKIELRRRRGELEKGRLFGDLKILDKPALIYAVAPALSFHSDFEFFARTLSPEIELWRWELHEHWRNAVKVIARTNY